MKQINFKEEQSEKKKSVSFKLSESVANELTEISKKSKMSQTWLVERAILLLANPSNANLKKWKEIYDDAYSEMVIQDDKNKTTKKVGYDIKEEEKEHVEKYKEYFNVCMESSKIEETGTKAEKRNIKFPQNPKIQQIIFNCAQRKKNEENSNIDL